MKSRWTSPFPAANYVFAILIFIFHPTIAIRDPTLCYKCQTLSVLSMDGPTTPMGENQDQTPTTNDPSSTGPPSTKSLVTEPEPYLTDSTLPHIRRENRWQCVNYAAASELEKENQFTVKCNDGCILAVDLREVNKSGTNFQLGFEYRGCFEGFNGSGMSATMKMNTCTNRIQFLKVYGENGQDFLKRLGLATPTEGLMKLCSCDENLCNLDLNKMSYYSAHAKREKQEKEDRRLESLRVDEERQRMQLKDTGAMGVVRLNVKTGILWMMWTSIFVINWEFILYF